MSNSDIAERFAKEAGKPDAKLLRSQTGTVLVSPFDERNLNSWGPHFTLARIMLDGEGNRSWWLLNGDKYSVSTSRHQTITREAVKSTGLPVLILPFSALGRAGIDKESIVPVDIHDERHETISHVVDSRDEVPEGNFGYPRDDGRFEYQTYRHWLGASVFKADYEYYDRERREYVNGGGYFLSAFDEQEPQPLYFLAELPQGAEPQSVEDALEALKPDEVKDAEAEGLTIIRQGDVFAIPTTKDTRTLKLSGDYYDTKHLDYVLGVNHTATDIIEVYGDQTTTYARGILRHEPGQWRQAEHKRQKMGDGKTWHLLVKNTVPEGRSWSMGGNVD